MPSSAAAEHPMVVLRVVGEVPVAVRAAVARGDTAELAEAQRAAVQLEPLHHQVVVIRLQPGVGHEPFGVAARAEDFGLETALVAA